MYACLLRLRETVAFLDLKSLFVNGEGVLSLTCGLVPRPALSAPAVEHSVTLVAVRSYTRVPAADQEARESMEREAVFNKYYSKVVESRSSRE